MAKDEGAGAGSILLAFLLGAAAGAAVALLYAPQTGDKTRELLGTKAREGADRAAKLAERAGDVISQGREQISHAIDKGREAYEQARREHA
jgi:gas vesicle protein